MASGGGSQSKQKQNTYQTQQGVSKEKSTPQWWGDPTMKELLPNLGNLATMASQRYQNPLQFSPQQQASWASTAANMNQFGGGGPYQQASNEFMRPVLEGGWGQLVDKEAMENRRQLLLNALPQERQLFSEEAAKQLGPYRSGHEAAAFGSGYGQLMLDQASRRASLEGDIESRIEAAKNQFMAASLQATPTYAAMQDPTQWGIGKLQFEGLPTAYTEAMRQQGYNELMPISQLMATLGLGAYQMPEETETNTMGTEWGRSTGDTKSGGSQGGISCCFIMNETGDLTDMVRKVRDRVFPPDSNVAKGYKKMAKWLVPIMRKLPLVHYLVKYIMTHPIAVLCERGNPSLMPIAMFWCHVWDYYGRTWDDK